MNKKFTRQEVEHLIEINRKQALEDVRKLIDEEIPDEYEDECPICRNKYKISPIIDKEDLKEHINKLEKEK